MSDELNAFADSVRQLAADHMSSDSWAPGLAIDDHNPKLSAALRDVGWSELAAEGREVLPYLGAGAVELGRAAAPFIDVLSILGGSPLAKRLALYGDSCGTVVQLHEHGYYLAGICNSEPVNFADSLGVHVVTAMSVPTEPDTASARIEGWETGMAGYLAGLADKSVAQAIDHARNREAFGKTLTQIETVQQRLAEAATVSEALVLSAREGATGLAALAHAATTVGSVMAHCHQVLGALGFTLEFPLQRYSRRSRAIAAFAHSWIDQRLDVAA